MIAVFENLKLDNPKDGFTVGIVDDVTHTSLSTGEKIHLEMKVRSNVYFTDLVLMELWAQIKTRLKSSEIKRILRSSLFCL